MSSGIFFNQAKLVFADFLTDTGVSENTKNLRLRMVDYFYQYIKTTRLRDLREMKEEYLAKFKTWLEKRKTKSGKSFAPSTRAAILVSVKQLFQSLYIAGLILTNPARSLVVPKGESSKKVILSVDEMKTLLESIGDPHDRALCELMYGSALRIGEVLKIQRGDLDMSRNRLRVRKSKFGRDRVVPVSEVALVCLQKYLGAAEVPSDRLVFFPHENELKRKWSKINKRIKGYAKKAGVMKVGFSSHSFRHSCATHLLEAGVSFEQVGKLLGHSSLETTVIYTAHLQRTLGMIYSTFHPGETTFFREVSPTYGDQVEKLRKTMEKRRWSH